MNGDTGTSTPHTTQLRALLFTDLCDSTELVERMGDAAAAELFQDHDRLVMALQQRWSGQQIDRSDGLFMLFERPVDALGFALDYQRGLQALGGKRNILLRARMGLHVGEVLLWNNSAESIALGAKPVEVEGLAKPMAARLMQLAQPGQLLVSSAAESMVRRAAGDLGEAAQGLKWKSYGRWRFKGVAQPLEVFGLQDPTLPSLGRPRQSAKASRDIPIWRQPMVMTAEVTLAAALLVGGWLLARPEPAIAFAERDWVVVGDLRNLTGETLLDGSLQQAFRISLEQSRYVNVISDLRARDAMQQMRLPPGAALDGSTASEVAERLGARLLLMPSIAEVGGQLRLSVEVIDPSSRQSLSVASVDGRGLASVLDSTDKVTAELRKRLGEASERVSKDSAPLPAVTTSSLDALRAYALGQSLYTKGDYPGALAMYEKAVSLDPAFALAWMAQVRARFANVDQNGAMRALDKVDRYKDRLPARESLYMDAWRATLLDAGNAGKAWSQLAALYPDYFAAHHNAAIWLYADNHFDEALVHAQRAADRRFELTNVAQDQMGRILLAKGDAAAARQALEQSVRGGRAVSHRYLAWVAASAHDFDLAGRELDKAGPSRHIIIEKVSIAADQQHWQDAQRLAGEGLQVLADAEGFDSQLMLLPATAVLWGAGDRPQALRSATMTVAQSLRRVADGGEADPRDDAMVALGASLIAVRMGDIALGQKVITALSSTGNSQAHPLRDEMVAVVKAEIARSRKDPGLALRTLQPWLKPSARFQTRVVAMEAFNDLDQHGEALALADGLAKDRGLAYAELDCGYCFQTLNVIDSNRAAALAATLRTSSVPTALVTAP